jgi:hypothetical protein
MEQLFIIVSPCQENVFKLMLFQQYMFLLFYYDNEKNDWDHAVFIMNNVIHYIAKHIQANTPPIMDLTIEH